MTRSWSTRETPHVPDIDVDSLVGFRREKEMQPGTELENRVDDLAQKRADAPPLALAWTKLPLNAMLRQLTRGAFEISIANDSFVVNQRRARR
jgi:enoyl-CoA hydratase/carnithine racemase